MAAGLEGLAKLGVVVDLAVEDEARALASMHRLGGPLVEIDDGEPPVREPDTGLRKVPLAVRAAVHERVRHALQQRTLDGRPVEMEAAGNPAHGRALCA